MTDHDLVETFEHCTLPNQQFRHADHVYVVWTYLRSLSPIEALERFTMGLKRFAAHHGKPGLYHETITWAYVALIQERIERQPASDWEEFCRQNPDLLVWRPSILDRYYRAETLSSEIARRIFILPDRCHETLPLPEIARDSDICGAGGCPGVGQLTVRVEQR